MQMFIGLFSAMAISALLSARAQTATPVITWASDPVRPDDTVLLSGGNFDTNSAVEVARLEQSGHVAFSEKQPAREEFSKTIRNWKPLRPIQITDNSAKFIIPVAYKMGVFACRLTAGNLKSDVVLINAPEVWWTQGDCGGAASPGGWLRVLGKSLNFGAASQAILKPATGKPVALKISAADCYNLSCKIPEPISDGDYTIYVHNGLGGGHAWKSAGAIKIRTPKPWSAEVYNVKQLGFATALAKAKQSGGGTIYFPRGQYEMKGQIVLPPQTVLKGEGIGLATIYWSTMENPPSSLLTGTSFRVEDISIYVEGFHNNVIEDSPASDGVKIKKVLLRANAFYGLTDIADMEKEWRGKKVLHSTRENGAAVRIHGSNFQITDCDILGSNKGLELLNARNGLIARNNIRYGIQGFILEAIDGLLLEDNQALGGHLAASGNMFSTYWSPCAQNVYVARNKFGQMYGYDREAFTFDGAGGAYWGKLAQINGTHMVLAHDPKPRTYKPKSEDWTGAAFCIIDGKGVGQYRRVAHNEGRAWELTRPWDIAPDTNSIISIIPFRGKVLFTDNLMQDAGIVQAYGTSLDCIFANNQFVRADGITLIGRNPHGWGWQPSWFCQILDNDIITGNRWGAKNGDIAVCTLNRDEEDAESGGSGKMLEFWGPLTRCAVVRGNVLENNAKIEIDGTVDNTVVEHCVIRNADEGIKVTKNPKNIVLRKNTFENVDNPRSGDGLVNALSLRQ
jgi:Pectate lyase superfamily protein